MQLRRFYPALLVSVLVMMVLAGCTSNPTTTPAPVEPTLMIEPTKPLETVEAVNTPVAASPEPTLAEPATEQPTVVPSETASPDLATAVTVPQTCEPTPMDALGPFYTPGAPVRGQVGEGYSLSGVVRSAADCQPIAGAQVEFWLAGPDGVYADQYRATVFAGEDGAYGFLSHFPPAYGGRPPHIHILVSAPGYQVLVTQHYPSPGASQADFDLVLLPEA